MILFSHILGTDKIYANDPNWKDLVLFYEFFDGETGRGCGARYVFLNICEQRVLAKGLTNNQINLFNSDIP